MNKNRLALIGVVLIFLLFLIVCFLFPLPSKAQKQPDEPRPQVLLVFNHVDASGKYVVQAKAQPILALRPLDLEAHLAPIERGTLMLCRPYNDGNHLLFRCGVDKFILEAISFQPDK